MFSLVSVYLFTGGVAGGPHVTITHDALELTVQAAPLASTSSGPSPGPLLVISGGHHCKPVQTYSCEDSLERHTGTRYTSYRNAF